MINQKEEVNKGYINKLKNKLYGLLCEKEKSGEWEKFLDSILIELAGFPEERMTINYNILCRKLSVIRYLNFEYFRKTIFECMNLLETLEG